MVLLNKYLSDLNLNKNCKEPFVTKKISLQ
jgi:hypothetical protein